MKQQQQPNVKKLNSSPKRTVDDQQSSVVERLREGFLLHQNNKISEAASIYLEVLKIQPSNFNALQLFGALLVLARQFTQAVEILNKAIEVNSNYAICFYNRGYAYKELKQYEVAMADFNKAISLDPNYIDSYVNRAILFLQLNQFEAAIEDYSKAIDLNPEFAEAYCNRGFALMELKQFDAAIAEYSKAITLKPDFAEAYCNRGHVLTELKDYQEAIEDCDRAIYLKSDLAEAFLVRGNICLRLKEFENAITNYSKAISLKPTYAEAYSNRGNANRELRRLETALSDYSKAISLKPDYVDAYSNRGCVYVELMEYKNALNDQDIAIKLKPDFAPAYSNRANALRDDKQYDEALIYYQKAINLKPDLAEAYAGHGTTKQALKQLDAALASYDKAISLKPDLAEAHANRGGMLRLKFQYIEALRSTKTALEINPQFAVALQNYATIMGYLSDYREVCKYFDKALNLSSTLKAELIWGNRLYLYIYHPDLDAHQIVAEHIKWGSQFASLGQDDFARHDRTPNRRLRVGYVSPDFRGHTCRFYFDPLFSQHNRADFELFAYSNVFVEDEHTQRMKTYFHHWRDIQGLTDKAAAQMIRDDQIDILVDGCGHMMDTRLTVFAHKPAPIQVTWLGSAWTTGLPQMDYVLFDPYMAPAEAVASEQIIRLPRTWAAFRPGEKARQATVTEAPIVSNGYITFGYSGRSERLNYKVFKVWGRILNRLPQARLVLDYKAFSDAKTQDYYKEFLQTHGIDVSRVFMRNSANIFEGLGDIDILLDSFPHSGGTMLFDAAWMGVPVVTLASARPVGRIGTSLMHNLGLPEWVANDEQEYEDKAVQFAQNVPALVNLRSGMRQKMQNSPVMDESSFANDVEQAFKGMWQTWVSKAKD